MEKQNKKGANKKLLSLLPSPCIIFHVADKIKIGVIYYTTKRKDCNDKKI